MAAPGIGFLLGQPTQFDAPFFRHAQASGKGALSVLYVKAEASSSVHDPELGRKVDWGFDLLSGYESKTLPASSRLSWLWDELRPERYRWLVINGYTTLPYLMALAIARLRGIRTALRIDSVLFNAGGWRRRAMKRVVLALLSLSFDRFLATGTLAREYLEHFGIAPDRISLFPYAVDADRFASEARAQDRAAVRRRFSVPRVAKVILAVAKMNAREAPRDLLGALDGLDRPDLWTVLVGDGPDVASLRAHVKERNLQRVVFAGYVPYVELAGCYAMADVFVHAAADEPWGVSVHEAIACGLPVVASSRVGSARDLILPGRNGFTYAAGDSADLRAKLAATIDTLDSGAVRGAGGEILARWSHARTWDGILEACK